MTEPLTGTIWQVESLDRGGIVDRSMVTLDFSEKGKLAGSGSCNRYFGSVTVDDNALSIGGVGSTMMACVDALMNQERRFFDALEAASAFEIEDGQWLVISDGDGNERIRAIRVESDPAVRRPEVLNKASEVVHTFACGALGEISFRFVGPDTIALKARDAQEQILTLQRAASGARYANGAMEFWNKGDEAMLTIGGVTHACTAT